MPATDSWKGPLHVRDSFLDQVETLLKSGHATEHSFRPALAGLFNSMLAPAQATNEPKHAEYGAPDFGIYRGSTPARPDSPASQCFTGIDPAT
ncbi:MAG TPA: hypothetical protein VLA19_25630 [Herpetosiphonaceae bacterium]|nr:hypothetical protein [Herpetosiphonaceae bacterium]